MDWNKVKIILELISSCIVIILKMIELLALLKKPLFTTI